ncbi:hypothetical protein PQ459_05485 [Chryseobacterium sp. KACC 21268]|nr:hypothetical protein PQ459_05485 [Chryseobacterium sp. KACC 21268]
MKLQKAFSSNGNIKRIMRNKNLINIFIIIIGIVISSVGVFFKITHWSFFGISASQLLLIGTILEIAGGLLLLYNLVFPKKSSDL